MVSTPTVASKDGNDTPRKEETTWSVSYVSPSGLLDPFDSLPIKLGLRQQKLLSYCNLHPIAGIVENNLLV
jgi:hypothetical protein